MSDPFHLDPYLDQLQGMADVAGLRLKDAFVAAGVPTSTYYRARCGTDLKADTARKVATLLKTVATGGKHAARQRAATHAVTPALS